MKRSYFSWIKELIAVVIIVVVVTNVASFLRKPELQTQNLPQFELISIEKEKISSNNFKDKPLLIHFWATWCPACKLEASNIQSISKDWQVITVAVNSGSDEELKKFMKERGLTYTVINDTEGEFAQSFSVSAFPTTFIYDGDGEISYSDVGYTSTLGLKLRMWLAN